MRERTVEGTMTHKEFRDKLGKLFDEYVGTLPSEEMLAVSAQACGAILALQDQRTMTPQRGMLIISKNLEMGNAQIISELRDKPAAGRG